LSVFETTLADNIAPEIQTQVNKRTDLFEKSINDLSGTEQNLEADKQKAVKSLGDGHNIPDALSSTLKQKGAELAGERSKLESIHENDLNTEGRVEMIRKNVLNELYPDYTRPLNKQYMEDAKVIAAGQNKLLDNLLGKLKELGVDCKTIKGDKKHEPEYFLKIKTTSHKDTVYNQTFCEELRNKYYCNDEVTLKCAKTGIRYNNWQDREIEFSGHEVYWQHNWWMVGIKWKAKRFGIHMKVGDSNVNNDVRGCIAKKLGVNIDQINEYVGIDARGVGNIFHVEGKSYTWEKFIFKYKYRDSYLVCEVWNEDWNERCRLQ
jgi:hypothetical protein